MNRILTALVLLLVAGVAFADDIGTATTFAAGLTPPSTDYSVAYLSQIFGTVGNVLVGTSGQIIGQMFAIFNKGVLVVAALWLCMTTVQMCLRAATEGSFMGQNKNVHMIMLRIALGFGLIIPSSATGYSLLQDLFMKIVVSGVALADQTWDAALNYIEYGGQLFIPPSTLSSDTDIISKTVGTGTLSPGSYPSSNRSLNLKPVTQIFQDEVCMIASSKKMWALIDSSGHRIYEYYRPQYNYTTGQINFPGVGDSDSNPAANECGTATSYFCANNPTLCAANASLSTVQHAEFDYSYSALKQLVDALLPVAENYVQQQESTTPPTTDEQEIIDKVNAKGIMVGIVGYGNLITPYQNLITQGNQKTDADKLDTAKAQGWIMAGAFYWNVEQDNNISSAVSISALLPTVISPTAGVYANGPTFLTNAANTVTQTYSTYIGGLWKKYVGAQQNNVSVSGGHESQSGGGVASNLTGSAVSQMVAANFQPGTGQNYNPIVALMSEGNNLLQIVVAIWITTISISAVAAGFAGFCNSTSPGGLIFKTVMSWMKSILMIVTGALLVPGAILAYYVPMYPFAVFTFAAIGWFGMVLEGMAAAPLVCLGVTHPEGHDFLGKAEQALMLFLSIFLRPALMVIGVIAFMVMSFVAFEMLIAGYGTLLDGLSSTAGTNSAFSGDGLLILITKTMVLVIFGFITMELIEQCAKLIYQVPNNINRWIGAPGMGEEYGQMASAVKGAVSSGAEQAGKGAQLGMESADSYAQMPGQGIQASDDRDAKRAAKKSGDGKIDPS